MKPSGDTMLSLFFKPPGRVSLRLARVVGGCRGAQVGEVITVLGGVLRCPPTTTYEELAQCGRNQTPPAATGVKIGLICRWVRPL